jgi:hypothetical protein
MFAKHPDEEIEAQTALCHCQGSAGGARSTKTLGSICRFSGELGLWIVVEIEIADLGVLSRRTYRDARSPQCHTALESIPYHAPGSSQRPALTVGLEDASVR